MINSYNLGRIVFTVLGKPHRTIENIYTSISIENSVIIIEVYYLCRHIEIGWQLIKIILLFFSNR